MCILVCREDHVDTFPASRANAESLSRLMTGDMTGDGLPRCRQPGSCEYGQLSVTCIATIYPRIPSVPMYGFIPKLTNDPGLLHVYMSTQMALETSRFLLR